MILIGTEAFDLAIAANGLVAAAGVGALHLAKVDLFQTNIAVDRNTPLGTLVAAIATFAGYAQGVVAWNAPSRADTGEIEVVGILPEWRPSDSVTPNSIYGLYMTNAVGGALLAVGLFDNPPLPMNSALDAIIATLRWKPKTGWAEVTVS